MIGSKQFETLNKRANLALGGFMFNSFMKRDDWIDEKKQKFSFGLGMVRKIVIKTLGHRERDT